METEKGKEMKKSGFLESEKKLVAHKLSLMVEAITVAYWGKATPNRFAKAWNNACKVLDERANGKSVSYSELSHALEWLVEASKDDERLLLFVSLGA